MAKVDLLENEISRRLKWLMFCRLIFSLLVISGIYFFYTGRGYGDITLKALGLYLFAAIIIFLSLLYSILFYFIKNKTFFLVVQVVIDTFLVTFLIYFTGVYNSVFQFFYLVIILYSSSFFHGGKPFWVASLVSIQYGVLVDLKYLGFINAVFESGLENERISGSGLFFQVAIFVLSSFAIAWLASLLSIQVRRAKADLKRMDEYVKRVERLAYAGEIAAGFAHEIKNPMASLRGSIQLLISDIINERPADVEKLGNIIMRESDRLDQLVNNFLFFARPGLAGKKNLFPDKEINDLVKIFKQDARVKNRIEILLDLAEEIKIEIDPDHFKQIIWNILLNSVDASSDNSKIFIRLIKKGDVAEIEIEDSGDGIPPGIMDKIFDPFFSTRKKGSGLGLSIVARLLELYGGTIDIRNSPQRKGTRVIIGFKSL